MVAGSSPAPGAISTNSAFGAVLRYGSEERTQKYLRPSGLERVVGLPSAVADGIQPPATVVERPAPGVREYGSIELYTYYLRLNA